jgi:hypothetical protein
MFRGPANYRENRRAALQKRVERLERSETKSTVNEPISVLALSVASLRGLVRSGFVDLSDLNNTPNVLAQLERAKTQREGRSNPPGAPPTNFVPIVIGVPLASHPVAAGDGSTTQGAAASATSAQRHGQSDDSLTAMPSSGSSSTET